MKKTRSTTLRRAWPSSDFSDRASDRMRSRSEKDYRLHKHFPPAFISQASRGYMTSVCESQKLESYVACHTFMIIEDDLIVFAAIVYLEE
ncbi:storkhead-box protein 2-like protein [Turdus rufiventris]|nr:storkhead-box protein 2-like protein [Turdus rufiventris]